MKAYLITTGAIFGLIAVMHIVKSVTDLPHLRDNPVEYGCVTALGLLAAGLSVWAWRLLLVRPDSGTKE